MSNVPSAAPAPAAAPVATPVTNPTTPTSGAAEGVKGVSTPSTEVKSTPKMYDIKVDGRTVKMSEEELIQHASLGKQAYSKFEESAKMRKEAEAFRSKLKENPIEALLDPANGLTKEQIKSAIENWYHEEVIQPTRLSPEQAKMKEQEKRLKEFENKEKQSQEQTKQAEFQKQVEAARTDLQTKLVEAIDTSGLPKTKFTVARAAYWMRRNLENGFDAPMETVMTQVKNERNEIMRDLVGSSDGERLIELLGGDAIVNKIRHFDLARLRGGNKPSSEATDPKPVSMPTSAKSGKGFTSQAEVDAKLREIRRTGKF